MASHYVIRTPEQVEFRYRLAGLGSRAMAWLIDQFILMALRIGIVIGVSMTVGIVSGGLAMALILLGIFGVDFGYFTAFELLKEGRTPGKRLFRLRVVSATGAELRFVDVLLRNLLRPVDSLPYGMLLGGVAALIDRYGRRLGDLVAETLVILEAPQALPQAMQEAESRHNSFAADPAIRQRILTRVTREQRDLLLELLFRRDQLQPQRREALFARAAGYFRRYFALPENLEHLSHEQTVINLALVVQADRIEIGGPAPAGESAPGPSAQPRAARAPA